MTWPFAASTMRPASPPSPGERTSEGKAQRPATTTSFGLCLAIAAKTRVTKLWLSPSTLGPHKDTPLRRTVGHADEQHRLEIVRPQQLLPQFRCHRTCMRIAPDDQMGSVALRLGPAAGLGAGRGVAEPSRIPAAGRLG